jgi:hypothetical protein
MNRYEWRHFFTFFEGEGLEQQRGRQFQNP